MTPPDKIEELKGRLQGQLTKEFPGIGKMLITAAADDVRSILSDLEALQAENERLKKQLAGGERDAQSWAIQAARAENRADDAESSLKTAREALEKIAQGDAAVFDEEEGCEVNVSMDAEEMSDLASATLLVLTTIKATDHGE